MWDQLDATVSDFIVNQVFLNMFRASLRHPQEVRLRFHCIWLSALLWLLWCWRVGWQAVCTVWSRLLDWSQATYSTQCTQLASRLSNITTVTTGQINICSENAVWPLEDGRIDARNMLKNNWLTIKSLIVASSWSHIYLLILSYVGWDPPVLCNFHEIILLEEWCPENKQNIFLVFHNF